jgi:predicted transcriptional regulator
VKIERQNTVETILSELIRRITQKRINLGLTQREASEQAGIGERTLRRLELGGDCQFSTIIRLLKTYDLIDRLNQLVPESTVSPIEFFEQQQKVKKRASKTVSKMKNKQWKWRDEQ